MNATASSSTMFQQLTARKHALARHRLQDLVDSAASLRIFVAHHAVCVFDFMSLLKSLQAELAPSRWPWTPPPDPEAARLINAIVLDEESDVLPHRGGAHGSHFVWYLDAMEELGCDAGPIRQAVAMVRDGSRPTDAFRAAGVPAAAIRFTACTEAHLGEPLAIRAGVFHHGREDVIPSMFEPLAARLAAAGTTCGILLGYLRRHIEVDGGEHGVAAASLVERLCAGNEALHTRALLRANEALEARLTLWDAIADAIVASKA